LQSRPYSPIVITNELAQAIEGICDSSKDVSDDPEPTDYPTEKKESKLTFRVETPKFNGHDYPSFVEKFSRFLRLCETKDAHRAIKNALACTDSKTKCLPPCP